MQQNAKSQLAAVRDFDLVQAARDFAGRLRDGAAMLYETFAAQDGRSGKALSGQIATRPFLSLLIVVGVGFCASRLFLSR